MSIVEGDTESSPQTSSVRRFTMVGDGGLPETYHLEGGSNFGVWAYRMKNHLQKDGRFRYCITPPSDIMGEEERTARQQVMSIINSNAKNSALKLLRRYHDPYECWTGLKTRYESDSGPRRVMLIEKFFALRKTESISMDAHLTEVKEVANLLEEVDVIIPEDIIVYYTLKNLPKEYEIFKRMQISAQSLPTYEQLEAKLISEETSIKLECQHKEDGEAFFSHHDRLRRPHNFSRYHPPATQTARNSYYGRRLPDSGGHPTSRPSNFSDGGGQNSASRFPNPSHPGHPGGSNTSRLQQNRYATTTPKGATQQNYQPKYRQRGPERPRADKCNFCGLDGHFERECNLRSILDRLKDYEHELLQQRDRNWSGQVHNIDQPEEILDQDTDTDTPDFSRADQVVDACLVELNLLETPSKTPSWYLDSGATHHVSGDSSIFSSIHSTSGTQVRSAGGQSHNVAGVGNVDIQLSSGSIKTISSVLYTPGITKNLLSVGTLTDHNKTLIFRQNGCFVLDNDTLQMEIFAPRETAKGLYRLSGAHTTSGPVVNMIYSNSPATLWHKRLGHFHPKGLQRMFNFGAVKGLPPLHFSNQLCASCHLGKNARKKMPKQTRHHTTQILELIHSDVCGPFRVKSLGGCQYFTTFIDDYSKRVWIYFLRTKSQVLSKFQHFVNQVETATGQRVKALRTDNGGEYTSRDFSDYCSSKGILRELVPPYTPERNGVAERKNRSILDITRCLLLDKILPSHLWGEAVKAAGDILNLRSTKRSPDKTPEELFYGKKPSIDHLRVFGSPVFVHIPKASRSKLAPRSEQCVLLSFDSAAKAYRCYRPSTRQVFISRDVSIDETTSTSTPPATSSPDDLPLNDIPAPTHREELLTQPPLPTTLNAAEDLQPTVPPSPSLPPQLSSSSPPPVDNGDLSTSPPIPTPSPNTPAPPPPPRRSDRIRRFPQHLQEFAAHIQLRHQDLPAEDLTDNITFKQASLNPHWQKAMKEEIASIYANRTWSLVPLPPDKKAITSKWVFKLKPGINGETTRFKARLVARGFEQTDGVDFVETFAPVVRWETIRILVAIAVHLNWPIHQLDVLTAFLNGILKEDVYMLQPPGFIKLGAEHLVCKLHRSLYGLKQSPRAWYARLHAALLLWNLIQSNSDPNLYYSHTGCDTTVLLVYVDDILITGSNPRLLEQLKTHLHTTFRTNDLGPIRRYLGVQFERSLTSLRMHQTDYAKSILQQFGMEDCAPSPTPLPEGTVLSKESSTPPVDATLYRMLVGKLLFLTKTRPDIAHAVGVVSRFMQNPQLAHLQATKHILRYIRRHPDLGLFYQQGEENWLNGYTDADYGQDIDDRASVGAYIFFLGNSPISWISKKQSSTSRSSCESEYRALAQCSCEAIWIRGLLIELKIQDNRPTNIYCDNQSSIKLSYNPVFHEKTKHFQIDYHFTRQKVEDNSIKVEYISSQEQPADILTKPLGRIKFETCREKLYLRTSLTLPSLNVLDSKLPLSCL